MSNSGPCGQQVKERLTGGQGEFHVPLEVGSLVEVVSNSGVTVYGVIRWIGVIEGKTGDWAGIELVSGYYSMLFVLSFI